MMDRKVKNNAYQKSIFIFALILSASLLPLSSSSIEIFYSLGEQYVYAQQQTTTATNPTINNASTTKLPEALIVTDNTIGDTQLPLRSSIINGKPTAGLTASEPGQGKLAEYFPIVLFHFKTQTDGFEEGNSIMKHLLIGPIKSYDSADIVTDEANYWKDIPLNQRVALEIDHPGPHYLIASVQFANGTSGIYSGVMDVSAIGIKPLSDDSIQFQLDGSSAVTGVAKIEQSDMAASELEPAFQQIASRIICSDLSDNGFDVCENGNEEAVLEDKENSNEDDVNSKDNDESDDDTDEDVEVRGDGGKDGRYDVSNCTGEQCEDADRETQQEKEGDYCDIDPGYCKDKDNEKGDADNEEDEEESEVEDDKEST